MAVGLTFPSRLEPVPGVRLGAVQANIKRPDQLDLVLIEATPTTRCAAVFTQNQFCAAPIIVARQHLVNHTPRYLLINTGFANAGTGRDGIDRARECCASLADLAGCAVENVLPFSTGVIGEDLPTPRIVAALPKLWASLSEDAWLIAAQGIMTTDTIPKGATRRFEIQGRECVVTGIAKGSGMIAPNMATMLAFIATDAAVDSAVLQGCLARAATETFNRAIVDGDTSTNDSCVLLATGGAGNVAVSSSSEPDYKTLYDAIAAVCLELAQALVRDGEGATKFITVEVHGGRDQDECLRVARCVSNSPLVKTAFFASDPNWGRILAAVGKVGLSELVIDRVHVRLGDLCIVRGGRRAEEYSEAAGRAIMSKSEITIRIDLDRGKAMDRCWTCDFSYDYVRINAEYRS